MFVVSFHVRVIGVCVSVLMFVLYMCGWLSVHAYFSNVCVLMICVCVLMFCVCVWLRISSVGLIQANLGGYRSDSQHLCKCLSSRPLVSS